MFITSSGYCMLESDSVTSENGTETLESVVGHQENKAFDNGFRSKQEIAQVVNANILDLNNIRNRYLEQKYFSGVVVLKFTIAPSGNIINISIISSTTDYPEFDNAVKDIVATWKWKSMDIGNVTCRIPFRFGSPSYNNECKSGHKGECCDKSSDVTAYPMICAEYFAHEIYNNYLSSSPNLAGVIFLKFMVNDNGFVINESIFLSTTENEKFDEDIKSMLRRYKWQKIYIKESPWRVKIDSIYNVTTTFTFGKQEKGINSLWK